MSPAPRRPPLVAVPPARPSNTARGDSDGTRDPTARDTIPANDVTARQSATYELSEAENAHLVKLLATGLPVGLRGIGLEQVELDDDNLVCTVSVSVKSVSFDTRTGQMVLALFVPTEHTYIALPLREMTRRKLVMSVHAPAKSTRGLYGVGAATSPSTEQTVRATAQQRVLERHAVRKLHTEMKYWFGVVDDDEWPE